MEQVWVCTDCGAYHECRDLVGDEACYDAAIPCDSTSIHVVDGRVVFARAIHSGVENDN